MDQVLVHHGIKGQRWGIRRFQSDDGTLTAAGKRRYKNGPDSQNTANSTSMSKAIETVRAEEKKAKKRARREGVALTAISSGLVFVATSPIMSTPLAAGILGSSALYGVRITAKKNRVISETANTKISYIMKLSEQLEEK